jgi:tetratricopeptide (TPR) repeat protein
VEVDKSSLERIESGGYSIHGCVHSWTIHVLNQEWDQDLARIAVEFIGLHIPEEQAIRPWLTQRRLLQHAARCSYIVLNGLFIDNGIEWAYYNLGLLYSSQGKLAEAEQMYQRALQGEEKTLGPEHISTLKTVNKLGALYADQDKLAEAEQMYQRALQGYEKALGAENIMTYMPALNTIWNLGSLFEYQADLAKAEIMFSKALTGYEKVVGPDHPESYRLREILQALDTVTGKDGISYSESRD